MGLLRNLFARVDLEANAVQTKPEELGRLAIRAQPLLRHPATPGYPATWKVLAREFSLQGNRPLIFRFYLKQNPPRLFGNEFGKTVGPFDY